MELADLAPCDVLSPERWEARGFFDRIGELYLLAAVGELWKRSE
jgi:hypothetical protein